MRTGYFIMCLVRLIAEQKAREAAAATGTADMAAAAEERVAAVEERAAAANERRVCHTEFIVELAHGGVM